MNKRPFIIDCDTGTDDAIAIVAALGLDDIDIVGITSVNGNVGEKYTSANNLDLMEYLGYSFPVCHGAVLPLTGNRFTATDARIHGKKGLGNIELPEARNSFFEERLASRFIYEEAKKRNGELELLVTGPMTNIAICVIQYPDFRDYIKHIYFMGGSTVGGNVNTTAEFNIWVDPEACHTVLNSGIPLTMVGLNVSNLAVMSEKEAELIRSFDSLESDLVADLLEYQMNRFHDFKGARMHDPLALASAFYPECMKYEKYYVDAECKGEYTRGHTAADMKFKLGKEANVDVAVDIDVEGFIKWLCERIRQASIKGKELRKQNA